MFPDSALGYISFRRRPAPSLEPIRSLSTENGMPCNAPRLRNAGLLIIFYSLASIASAQWVWRDQNGHVVYSDVPPPPSVKPRDIVQQPTLTPMTASPDSSQAATPPAVNATAAAAPTTRTAAPPAPTMAEREQEFRKRMKERADAEKKQADEQTRIARAAEDCQRARGYMKSLEDGMRLVRTNPDGSREPLDESQRAAETQRAQQIIQDRCR
jgi:predicted component of type VI protein secretion system